MKSRLHTIINAGLSVIKPGLTRSPEPVAPAAAIGDGSNPPTGGPQRGIESAPPEPAKLLDDGAIAPYVGEDRRGNDRRRGKLPTTLDTRKFGVDRRINSRISLKV